MGSPEEDPHFYDQFGEGTGWPPLQFIWHIGVVASQFVSTLLGGDPDETLSSRLGKAVQANVRWAKAACWLLDTVMMEPNHCIKSINPDDGKRELISFIHPWKSIKDLFARTFRL